MPREYIIDAYAHLYRTAEIGRQALQDLACQQRWRGEIDELRVIMRATGIWRTVIATVTPTRAMQEKELSQLPADLGREARAHIEADIRKRLLQRMDQNNFWG